MKKTGARLKAMFHVLPVYCHCVSKGEPHETDH